MERSVATGQPHGGNVAQIDGKRFAAQLAGRGCVAQEVHPLGQQVGREEQRFAALERRYAQSSPMPSKPLSGSAAKSVRMWSMNPNSVMVVCLLLSLCGARRPA